MWKVILILVVGTCGILWAIPTVRRTTRQRLFPVPERSASLKTIAATEVDFRGSDRDGGRVHDFWVDWAEQGCGCSGAAGSTIPLMAFPKGD